MVLPPKTLPNDEQAEMALIGCLVTSSAARAEVGEKVSEDDFYHFPCKIAFQAISEMSRQGRPVDIVTLADFVHGLGKIKDCSYEFIASVYDSAPSVGNAPHYAKIVIERSKRRKVIHGCERIAIKARDLTTPIDEVVAEGGELFFATLAMGEAKKARHQSEVVRELYELMDRQVSGAADGEVEVTFLPSGWESLDQTISGFTKSELAIVAARPSVGKTIVAGCLARQFASRGNHVLFCSIEQKDTAIIQRMFSSVTKIPGYKIFRGLLDKTDIEVVMSYGPTLEALPIWWVDSSSQSVSEITNVAKRIKLKGQLDAVIVDYLQIIRPDGGRVNGTRSDEIGKMTWGLKQLARELNIPVIVLCQLNRGVANRTDPTPKLSDLRESGNIEQDADTVLLLHKTEEPDIKRPIDELIIIVGKQRNGPLGAIKLQHHKDIFDITDASGSHGYGESF